MANVSADPGTAVGTTCTDVPGLNLSIKVPGPGRIVVQGSIVFDISHTSGTLDEVDMTLAPAAKSCTVDAWTTFAYVSAALPTGTYWPQVLMEKVFTVTTAGTYTYYANAHGFGNAATGAIEYSSLIVVFYPG